MANYSGRKCWMVKYLQTNRSDEHEQAFKCYVVQSVNVNNATPSRVGQYESTHRMKQNKSMNENKIYILSSSMINVRCASVNQARAVVHEFDAEARAQAHTLRNAWIICIWKHYWGFAGCIERRTTSSSWRTWSTNLLDKLIDERLCARTKKKAYIVMIYIID